MLAFLAPKPPLPKGLGEFSIGLTAGKGMDGAGEADLRIEGDEPNDERRLCDMAGGFIGSARDVGVPGIEGAGEAGANAAESGALCGRGLGSSAIGAGLLVEILRAGRSIFIIRLC